MIFFALLLCNPNRMLFSRCYKDSAHFAKQTSFSKTTSDSIFTTENILYGFLPTKNKFSK